MIPIDINPSTMSISLYYGTTNSIQFDPCVTTSQLVDTVRIAPPTSANFLVNETVVSFTIPDQFVALARTRNQFFMMLSDPAKRQCLLGPNSGQNFNTFITFNLNTVSASTVPSSQGTGTALPSQPTASNRPTAASTNGPNPSRPTGVSTNGPIAARPTSTSDSAAAASSPNEVFDLSKSPLKLAIVLSVSGFVLIATIVGLILWRRNAAKKSQQESATVPNQVYYSDEIAPRGGPVDKYASPEYTNQPFPQPFPSEGYYQPTEGYYQPPEPTYQSQAMRLPSMSNLGNGTIMNVDRDLPSAPTEERYSFEENEEQSQFQSLPRN
jgi:hypothetical protein